MSGYKIISANERGQEANLLVQAARMGDPGAFEQLVKRYRPRVFALALHLTGKSCDADDISQEVFLRAYSKIQEFEQRSAFFTWLFRITLNLSLNHKRDNRRHQRAVHLDDDRVRIAVSVDASDNPRLVLELRESYTLLVRALDQLSASLRTAVILVALQGLSYKEAAVVLDSTEGTIAWRIHEARTRLHRTIRTLTRDPTPLPHRSYSAAVEELRSTFRSLRVDSVFPAATKL